MGTGSLNLKQKGGFTLIEVIVILSLGALIAAMVAPFVGTAVSRSADPLNRIIDAYKISGVMEAISAEYQKKIDEGTLDLPTFKGTLSRYDDPASGITVTGTYVDFWNADGDLVDNDADGVYDPLDLGNTETGLLSVSVSIDNHTLTALFAK